MDLAAQLTGEIIASSRWEPDPQESVFTLLGFERDKWTSGSGVVSQPPGLDIYLCHFSSPCASAFLCGQPPPRSEEHTSELQSLMRISYAVFCLKKKKNNYKNNRHYKYYILHLNFTK